MPPNTRASYSVELRSIQFTPSIPSAETFFFGNNEKNTFCCLCAEDIEPPFTQRMHIAASSRASHTNHTCREVVLDHMALLGMRGYPLDQVYDVWSDVLYHHPMFPRIRALTSPLWSWERRAAALLPYLTLLREMGVLDLCLAAVSPLLGGGGGGSGASSSSSTNVSSLAGMGLDSHGNGIGGGRESAIPSSGASADSYHTRRRVAFERVEYIGDCAWGNNVASRLILLYPNEQWQYGERVYNFNCMRDAAEMNITLELLFDSLRLAELLPTRCVEHVGSGKIKADVVEAVLGELHITIWGLQPEIEDDTPFVEINGEREASLLMLVQHCLTEMYDLLVLGYVRELSGNALPLAKSLAAKNIWMEIQPFLRHHKTGRQRHWSRHRGGVSGWGMALPSSPPRVLATPAPTAPLSPSSVPSATPVCSTLWSPTAAVTSLMSTTTTTVGNLSPTFTTPPTSTSGGAVVDEAVAAALSESSVGSCTEEKEGMEREMTPTTVSPKDMEGDAKTEAIKKEGSADTVSYDGTTLPLLTPFSSSIPTRAPPRECGIGESTGSGIRAGTGFGYPRFVLPALPLLHSSRTSYPITLPHPLLAPENIPPTYPPEGEALVRRKPGSVPGHSYGGHEHGEKVSRRGWSTPPASGSAVNPSVSSFPTTSRSAPRHLRPSAFPSLASSPLMGSSSPSFAARLQLTRYTYTGTDVFSTFRASFYRLGMIREDTRHLFSLVPPMSLGLAVQRYQRSLVPSVLFGMHREEKTGEVDEEGGKAGTSRALEDRSGGMEPGDGLNAGVSEALRMGFVDDAAHRGEVFFRDPYYELTKAPHTLSPPMRATVLLPSPQEKEMTENVPSILPNHEVVPLSPTLQLVSDTSTMNTNEARSTASSSTVQKDTLGDGEGVLQGSALLTPTRPSFLRIPFTPYTVSVEPYPALQIAVLYAFPSLKETATDEGDEEGEEGEGKSAADLTAAVVRYRWRRSRWTPPGLKAPTPGAITQQHPLHPGAFAYLGVGIAKALDVSMQSLVSTASATPSEDGPHESIELTVAESKKEEKSPSSMFFLPEEDNGTSSPIANDTEAVKQAEGPTAKEEETSPSSPALVSSASPASEDKNTNTVEPSPLVPSDGASSSTSLVSSSSLEQHASPGTGEEKKAEDQEEAEEKREEEQKEKEKAAAAQEEEARRASAWALWLQRQKEKKQRENPYFPSRLVFPHFSTTTAGRDGSSGVAPHNLQDGAAGATGGGHVKRPSRLTPIGGAASNIPIFQCQVSSSTRPTRP